MGTKVAEALADIFRAKIEKEILRQKILDDVISMYNTRRETK